MKERRKLRSANPNTAASFYMMGVAQRHDIEAVVLADVNGRFLAGAESNPHGEERVTGTVNPGYGVKIAKSAPHACTDADRGEHGVWTGKNRIPLWASRIDMGGNRYLLAVIGKDGELAAEACKDAKEGFSRIYGDLAA